MHVWPYEIDTVRGHVFGLYGRPARRVNGRGYIEAKLKGKAYLVHRLVWEKANGPIPHGMQVNHINGVKTDNRLENLELTTPSGNLKHAYRLGLCRADGQFNGRYIGKNRRTSTGAAP